MGGRTHRAGRAGAPTRSQDRTRPLHAGDGAAPRRPAHAPRAGDAVRARRRREQRRRAVNRNPQEPAGPADPRRRRRAGGRTAAPPAPRDGTDRLGQHLRAGACGSHPNVRLCHPAVSWAKVVRGVEPANGRGGYAFSGPFLHKNGQNDVPIGSIPITSHRSARSATRAASALRRWSGSTPTTSRCASRWAAPAAPTSTSATTSPAT